MWIEQTSLPLVTGLIKHVRLGVLFAIFLTTCASKSDYPVTAANGNYKPDIGMVGCFWSEVESCKMHRGSASTADLDR